MPELDLNELERLAKAATPGPWYACHDINGDIAPFIEGATGWVLGEGFDPEHDGECWVRPTFDDLEYIVAACNSLPALIQRVRELERQRDWLATFIEDNMDCEQCPYYEDTCKPKAPVDCYELISQKAKETGE